jgi:hypothetical protein
VNRNPSRLLGRIQGWQTPSNRLKYGKDIRKFKRAIDTQEIEEVEATSKKPAGLLGRKE